MAIEIVHWNTDNSRSFRVTHITTDRRAMLVFDTNAAGIITYSNDWIALHQLAIIGDITEIDGLYHYASHQPTEEETSLNPNRPTLTYQQVMKGFPAPNGQARFEVM